MFRYFLNVHTSLGRGNDHRHGCCPVHQHREVIFFFNIGGFVKINGADLLALFPGLLGDQNIAEHGLGFFLGIVRGMHDVHPSLVAVFKGSLTPSTRMNLGFYYNWLSFREA